MYIYIYIVYMYIYIYEYIYIDIFIYICIYIHTYIHAYIHKPYFASVYGKEQACLSICHMKTHTPSRRLDLFFYKIPYVQTRAVTRIMNFLK